MAPACLHVCVLVALVALAAVIMAGLMARQIARSQSGRTDDAKAIGELTGRVSDLDERLTAHIDSHDGSIDP